jgi:cytochrome c553
MNARIALSLVMSLVLASVAFAEGDPAAGKAKSAMCLACHGADGNSTNPEWPKIAGQHAGYIAKQLRDFKAGKQRNNPVMFGMVAALSEQDMENLGVFYASQTQTGGFASESSIAVGERLYRGGNKASGVPACIACHGPTGTGNPLGDIPMVSGQFAKYTAAQLRAFRVGSRSNDRSAMMRDAVQFMSEAEIDAVASYLAGLH